jgi:hypothetical protein
MIPTSATYGLKRLDDAVLKPGDIVLKAFQPNDVHPQRSQGR